MTAPSTAANRRQFLIRSAVVAGGLAAGVAPLAATSVVPRHRPPLGDTHSKWLERLRGEEKYLFDSPAPANGRVLGLIRHFLDTYQASYGVSEDQLGVAGTFYSGTTFLALDDTAWERYALGEFQDPVVPSDGNPWRAAPDLNGTPAPTASIEALASRGVVFILCRAALVSRATQVAARRGLPASQVLADLESHVLPQVTVVPSVIVEIQRAQRRGVAYYRVP